jgi:hypothetical protein
VTRNTLEAPLSNAVSSLASIISPHFKQEVSHLWLIPSPANHLAKYIFRRHQLWHASPNHKARYRHRKQRYLGALGQSGNLRQLRISALLPVRVMYTWPLYHRATPFSVMAIPVLLNTGNTLITLQKEVLDPIPMYFSAAYYAPAAIYSVNCALANDRSATIDFTF